MDNTVLLSWVSFALTCLYILVYTSTTRRSASKHPPGPFPLPILGSLYKLGKNLHETLAELADTYGPIMSLKLGSVSTIVVSSSNMAKEVLQKHDQAFAGRPLLDVLRVHNHHKFSLSWSPACPRWRTLRKICSSQMFSTQNLDANQGIRYKKIEELLAYIRSNCPSLRAMDIGQAAFITVLNLLSNIVFSVDLANLNSDSGQEFKAIVKGILEEAGKPNFSDYFPWLRPLDLQGIRRRLTTKFEKLDELFDRMITERIFSRELGTSPSYKDVLDTLLDQNEESDFKLGNKDINALVKNVDQIVTKRGSTSHVSYELRQDIFIAGTDTSSSTLEWAMAELMRNPNIMTKARMELNEIIGQYRPITESDIAKLPYLQAILKETLRLHPPTPLLLPHRAETNVEICDFIVPKHAQVLVNAWAIGRDPMTWDNSTLFIPERFLESEIDFAGRNFEFIPFGAGRRICPGLPLAYRMVHLMLASLIYSFEWMLEGGIEPKDMDMQETFGLTLHKAKPLMVVPTKGLYY